MRNNSDLLRGVADKIKNRKHCKEAATWLYVAAEEFDMLHEQIDALKTVSGPVRKFINGDGPTMLTGAQLQRWEDSLSDKG